ncbi:Hydroxyisourate hydrolase [Aspergillus uvarum CBS 121591]|uniref:hydroxyisourate hydrolase n=1 Tax=Aspergillus uvarum CBS 121591 TaxID=1448315 RepID=A0A319CKF5_9EURO|nr:Hydroxyisourate hydrolase [Aspergillus uvarum CBS 121591]PYH86075.1 Hydroxyisourate hydrolase [Aspergillus uvarum CBS 121591]
MDSTQQPHQPSTGPIHRAQITERLSLVRNQLNHTQQPPSSSSSFQSTTTTTHLTPESNPLSSKMSRDPITCHVLNTLTGTPAANLPVTLTLLSSPTGAAQEPPTFRATTNADGRVAIWEPLTTSSSQAQSVPAILAALPASDSKTNWAVRFEVGPWYEAQGVESFWPEVEVKFTVKGRGKDGEEGWRHYHVPVLLGPWNYSTYRGS